MRSAGAPAHRTDGPRLSRAISDDLERIDSTTLLSEHLAPERHPDGTHHHPERRTPAHAREFDGRHTTAYRGAHAGAHGAGHAVGHGLGHGAEHASTATLPFPVAPGRAAADHRLGLGVKRAIDVVGAAIGLILALPVLLVLAVLVRLESPGGVIFAHERVGRHGRRFRCLKLRTMRAGADALLDRNPTLRATYRRNGFKLPAHVDDRITPFGRFLRTTSLDELPQFWNVLRGDMSLVGPRPVVLHELAEFGSERDLLLSVRPGITGAWAVAGRSRIGYPERARIELEYVRHWSLWRDLAILARTTLIVLQRRGAY